MWFVWAVRKFQFSLSSKITLHNVRISLLIKLGIKKFSVLCYMEYKVTSIICFVYTNVCFQKYIVFPNVNI